MSVFECNGQSPFTVSFFLLDSNDLVGRNISRDLLLFTFLFATAVVIEWVSQTILHNFYSITLIPMNVFHTDLPSRNSEKPHLRHKDSFHQLATFVNLFK